VTARRTACASYSIFLDDATGDLFAYAEVESDERWQAIAGRGCRRWWARCAVDAVERATARASTARGLPTGLKPRAARGGRERGPSSEESTMTTSPPIRVGGNGGRGWICACSPGGARWDDLSHTLAGCGAGAPLRSSYGMLFCEITASRPGEGRPRGPQGPGQPLRHQPGRIRDPQACTRRARTRSGPAPPHHRRCRGVRPAGRRAADLPAAIFVLASWATTPTRASRSVTTRSRGSCATWATGVLMLRNHGLLTVAEGRGERVPAHVRLPVRLRDPGARPGRRPVRRARRSAHHRGRPGAVEAGPRAARAGLSPGRRC
jgi:hypothetical protein